MKPRVHVSPSFVIVWTISGKVSRFIASVTGNLIFCAVTLYMARFSTVITSLISACTLTGKMSLFVTSVADSVRCCIFWAIPGIVACFVTAVAFYISSTSITTCICSTVPLKVTLLTTLVTGASRSAVSVVSFWAVSLDVTLLTTVIALIWKK